MLWLFRAAWFALPVTLGPALAHTLEHTSAPVTVVAAALAALSWGTGLVAMLVPRSVSLTVLRAAVPAAFAVAVACAVRAGDGVGASEALGLTGTAVPVGLLFGVSALADAFVDGSSYGDERRFALRTPLALAVGPAPLAWAATVGPSVAAPLLLAAKAWVPGAVMMGLAAVLAPRGADALHRLSRRWAVFVPAGFVLHDPLALAEPVLFPRRMVRAMGPAPAADADVALDTTGGATGLVIELVLTEPVTMGVRAGRGEPEGRETDRVLFCAARPGAVLAEAAQRRLAVAVPPPTTSSPA